MKLIITTITMIFISFVANAVKVEQLYKDCKPFQNNGFTFDNLSSGQIQSSLMCVGYLRGLADRGYMSCGYLMGINERKLIDTRELEVIALLTTNGKFSINPLITSFINFAENNLQKWKFSTYNYTEKFIGKIFPCKIKE